MHRLAGGQQQLQRFVHRCEGSQRRRDEAARLAEVDVWPCCCMVEGHSGRVQEREAAGAHKAPTLPYPA